MTEKANGIEAPATPMTKEQIINSPIGLRFNTGKLRWGLVHFKSLEPLVRVLMFGAEKYTDNNWQKGLNEREILECAQRHLAAMLDGELIDKESGLPHVGHLMCNALFYSYFQLPENKHKLRP